MKKFLSSQLGQGLLEMVFAIGILLIVVAAILALTTSNIVGQKESEFQIVANNLAREGIEVVRNIRDSNWLSGQPWDQGLVGNAAIAEFNPANDSWQLDFDYSPGDELLYFSANNVFSHTVSGQQTIYERELNLDNICLAAGQENIRPTCQSGEQKIGLKITSVVKWIERGRNRKVTLEDLLYEWK